MSEIDHNDLIQQLVEVCNTDTSTAQHYLEAYNWQLNDAIQNLVADIEIENPIDSLSPISSPTEINSGINSQQAKSISSKVTNIPTSGSSDKPRIATLSSINRRDPQNSDSDEEKQAFYVGGAETGGGGQQVLGPRHRNSATSSGAPTSTSRNPDEFVQNVFRQAREGGAETLDYSRVPGSDTGRSDRVAFAGTGYRLGECLSEELVPVPGEQIPERREKITVVVKMWRDGFSLDDGPLRAYTAPESIEFMESIKRGQIPSNLIQGSRTGEVHVLMEDHHSEEWVASPPSKAKAFSGAGHILGNPTPKISFGSRESQPDLHLPAGPIINEDLPTTQVNVRLPDGSRLKITLNHEHTVDDLRSAIISQRPELVSIPFSLLTTFPRKDLTDGSTSLSTANLLNAVIVLTLN